MEFCFPSSVGAIFGTEEVPGSGAGKFHSEVAVKRRKGYFFYALENALD